MKKKHNQHYDLFVQPDYINRCKVMQRVWTGLLTNGKEG
jgi:hypothetical protein